MYELLTSKGVLSDEHKKELIEKRGFNEDVVKQHRFFSGGKYLLDFEKDFVGHFSEDDLTTSGLFVRPEMSGGKLVMAKQILDNRIIIPYLNKEGKAYFVRPHKMGLEAPIRIYHEKILQRSEPHAILTESEFKAVAGDVFGFRTIGIPGIGSFADAHFEILVKFLQEAKIKQICILYDNEVKDNPAYPNYKEDAFKRYDTEYFSYLMASGLQKEGIECRIGKLPDSWRRNGKVDLDSALSQGHTNDDIRAIIADAKLPKAFVQELSAEAQSVLNRKLAKKYHRSNISTEFGKYVATRRAGKTEWQETISNFTLRVIARHETSEGVVREVVLVDEFGKFSSSFPLSSTPMVKRDLFADFVMNKGNYVWTGNNDDLANIWKGLFLEDDGRHIVEPDHVGWIDKEKIFMFGNLAFNDKGEEIRPDKHNIFWRDKHGLKPVPISIHSGNNSISEGVPIISRTPIDLLDIRKRFVETLGKFEAYQFLGWIGAVHYMENVFETYNCFPFMFITGRRGSGKSTIAEWGMNCFGIETGGKMAGDTTPVAIQRYLAYYSSLPVYIDEYRNTKQIAAKNGFLRNVYNRQSAGKGIKAAFGVREGKVRGTLLVSGEETPEDNALLTRCVVINVRENNRAVNHFNWFQNHRGGLSYLTHYVLSHKPERLAQFMENLKGGKQFFVDAGLDDRMAINYAVIGAGYCAIFGELPTDFQQYLAKESLAVKVEYEQEHAMQVFWNDILAFQSNGKIREPMWVEDGDRIFVYFHGLYTIWAAEHRAVHGVEPFKAAAIRKYMEEEPGFIEFDVLKRIGKYGRRCVVFLKDKAPGALLELVDSAQTNLKM